ncbi:MAG: alpha-1,2-fucosyltransferase [Arcicella sp.]|nr:alpha-1,2-fucosyltransferase [Arcicella sp.]
MFLKKTNKIIIIQLQGGLGNQMFQYAFARILAKRNSVTLKLDRSFFDTLSNVQEFTQRNFELGIFKNVCTQASSKEIIKLTRLSFINKIKKKLGVYYKSNIYSEPYLDFQSEALSIKAPVYIKGYFQSYKYFENQEDLIRETFCFPVGSLEDRNKALLSKLQSETTISVHIRRGDYVTNSKTQQFHGNCSLEYYSKAIALLASKTKKFTLVFFSEDSQWVKEQFGNLQYSKLFIDYNTEENSWIDMFLMSSCSHNIIANSSFSWWAAYLNKQNDKIVIAPKKWYANLESNTNDLIPPQWIRL